MRPLIFPYSYQIIPEETQPFKGYSKKYYPVIFVAIRAEKLSGSVVVELDTGSQYCLFNNEYAEEIGILDYKHTKDKQTLKGIGGKYIQNTAYFHEVELLIYKDWQNMVTKNSLTIKTKVGFLENPIDIAGVLGVHGFFDQFEVTFNIPKEQIKIAAVL